MDDPSIASARWMHGRAAYDVAISTAKVDAWEHAGAAAQTRWLNEVVDRTRVVHTKVGPVLKTADFLAAAPVAFMGLAT